MWNKNRPISINLIIWILSIFYIIVLNPRPIGQESPASTTTRTRTLDSNFLFFLNQSNFFTNIRKHIQKLKIPFYDESIKTISVKMFWNEDFWLTTGLKVDWFGFYISVETRRVTLHFSRSRLRSLTKNIEMVIRWWTWNSHPAHSTSPEGCATSADGVTPKKGPIRHHMCFRWKVDFNF